MCSPEDETHGANASELCGGTSRGRDVPGEAEADTSRRVGQPSEVSVSRYPYPTWIVLIARGL